MSGKEKPLPKPPSTPFGRKKRFEHVEEKEPLIADELAMAMAEGKFEEFLKNNLPDSEHARKLAEMMMGMTGMFSPGGLPEQKKYKSPDDSEAYESICTEEGKAPDPPREIVNAVQSGDVEGLMSLLYQERQKRISAAGLRSGETDDTQAGRHIVEKEILDQMMKIASDNNVSQDWLLMRAIKLYIREYQRTGRL
ncbi:MAG: hypothetical protein AB1632_04695 [Nitrospirota bacterium]